MNENAVLKSEGLGGEKKNFHRSREGNFEWFGGKNIK